MNRGHAVITGALGGLGTVLDDAYPMIVGMLLPKKPD